MKTFAIEYYRERFIGWATAMNAWGLDINTAKSRARELSGMFEKDVRDGTRARFVIHELDSDESIIDTVLDEDTDEYQVGQFGNIVHIRTADIGRAAEKALAGSK